MSDSDPRGTTFCPKYRVVLWFGVGMSIVTSFLLIAIAAALGYHWGILLGIFMMPVGTILLVLWQIVYRSITFEDQSLVLHRYFFADIRMPYGAIEDVGASGFRSGRRGVSWELMQNGDELERRVQALDEQGVLEGERAGEMDQDVKANQTAVGIVVGIVCGIGGGLGVSTEVNLFSWQVLLLMAVVVLVATPTLRSVLRKTIYAAD